MIYHIETDDGKLEEYNIPGVEAITFDQFCDFQTAIAAFEKAVQEEDDTHVALLGDAVRVLVTGNIDLLPYSVPGDNLEQMITQGHTLKPGSQASQLRLYAHLITQINRYHPETIPETIKVLHKGKAFTVTRRRAAAALLDIPITTGEAIEALEYQRRAAEATRITPVDGGNIDFNLGLTEFAILIRQDGERLPSSRQDRDRFIARRKEMYRTLPLTDVLDVRFFFIIALLLYRKTPPTSSFGMVRLRLPAQRKPTLKESVRRWLHKAGQ